MMARILAQKPDPENGVGLHHSRFRRYSAFPTPSNQLLAPARPRKNRHHRPPIREVGLAGGGAGTIVIAAVGRLDIIGGAIESETVSTGNAGDVRVTARSVRLAEFGSIASN